MSQEETTIQLADGEGRAWVFTPEGAGPWPGVIFYSDAFGIRPAMKEMAQHLADQGYVVLLPDLFFRAGPYGPLVPKDVFRSGELMAAIGPLMASTDNHRAAQDTGAYIAYLDGRSDVKGDKIGTVGFCFGGGIALTAAAFHPDRVAAAASFHGGGLASDKPTSPHLQADRIRAEVYVAGADHDANYPPEMAERLEAALRASGVTYRSEIYADKLHGWMKPDMPIYDAEAAERGWREAFDLFGRTLG